MKEIKQKKSYLNAFFNDTDAGIFISNISVIVFGITGMIFVPYGNGKLILFLLKSKGLINNPTRDYFNIYGIGFIGLAVMLICIMIIAFIYEAAASLRTDMKLAHIYQYLPVTKEDWANINFRDSKQMYAFILYIFKEYNVDNLLNLEYLKTCDKLGFTLLDTVKAGYSHLVQLNTNPTETESYKWALQLIDNIEIISSANERNDFILSNMLNREMTDETKKAIADLEAGRKEAKINENKTEEITF